MCVCVCVCVCVCLCACACMRVCNGSGMFRGGTRLVMCGLRVYYVVLCVCV